MQSLALVACIKKSAHPKKTYMSAVNLRIKIFDPSGTRILSMPKSTVTIGGATHCDLVLEHHTIAVEHVRAWLDGGRIWIQDLATASGTSVNGSRLPPLKPMLLRDMDVIALGECPAKLGLEVIMVRAPVVKAQAAIDEITATDIRRVTEDSESRRPDAEALSRELADLKLQIQMQGLEKESVEDLRRQLVQLKQEFQQVSEQRQRLAEKMVSVEHEKQTYRKNLEHELADHKLKALRDLKEQREYDLRQFEQWKVSAVVELNQQIQKISQAKVKTWVTRPVSKDMVLEWEGDLNQLLRRVILNEAEEEAMASSMEEDPLTNASGKPSTGSKVYFSAEESGAESLDAGVQATATSNQEVIDQKRKTQKKRPHLYEDTPAERLKHYILLVVGAGCVGILVYLSLPYLNRSMNRGPQLVSSIDSIADSASLAAASNMPSTNPSSTAETSTPTSAVENKTKAKHSNSGRSFEIYRPKQSKGYKKSYAENMLFTLNFDEAELNRDFRRKWIRELTKAVRIWKLDPLTVRGLIDKEIQMLADLRRIKTTLSAKNETQVLAQMRQREQVFMRDLRNLLKSNANVDRFLKFKRGFFESHSKTFIL